MRCHPYVRYVQRGVCGECQTTATLGLCGGICLKDVALVNGYQVCAFKNLTAIDRNLTEISQTAIRKSPGREVVRSSAGAGIMYPPFGGSFA